MYTVKMNTRGNRTPIDLKTYTLGDRNSDVFKEALALTKAPNVQQGLDASAATALLRGDKQDYPVSHDIYNPSHAYTLYCEHRRDAVSATDFVHCLAVLLDAPQTEAAWVKALDDNNFTQSERRYAIDTIQMNAEQVTKAIQRLSGVLADWTFQDEQALNHLIASVDLNSEMLSDSDFPTHCDLVDRIHAIYRQFTFVETTKNLVPAGLVAYYHHLGKGKMFNVETIYDPTRPGAIDLNNAGQSGHVAPQGPVLPAARIEAIREAYQSYHKSASMSPVDYVFNVTVLMGAPFTEQQWNNAFRQAQLRTDISFTGGTIPVTVGRVLDNLHRRMKALHINADVVISALKAACGAVNGFNATAVSLADIDAVFMEACRHQEFSDIIPKAVWDYYLNMLNEQERPVMIATLAEASDIEIKGDFTVAGTIHLDGTPAESRFTQQQIEAAQHALNRHTHGRLTDANFFYTLLVILRCPMSPMAWRYALSEVGIDTSVLATIERAQRHASDEVLKRIVTLRKALEFVGHHHKSSFAHLQAACQFKELERGDYELSYGDLDQLFETAVQGKIAVDTLPEGIHDYYSTKLFTDFGVVLTDAGTETVDMSTVALVDSGFPQELSGVAEQMRTTDSGELFSTIALSARRGERGEEDLIGVLCYTTSDMAEPSTLPPEEQNIVEEVEYLFFYKGDTVFVTNRYGHTVDTLR